MIKLISENWTIENIETVLLDKDGTFIDLHYFWGKMTELRAQQVIKAFGMQPTIAPKLCEILGYDVNTQKMLPDGITALYSRIKIIEIFKAQLETFGVHTTKEEIEKIFDKASIMLYKEIHKYTKPIDEAIDFIKDLREKGVKIGIVTSDSVVSTELAIRYFRWDNLFDISIGRESSEHTKESGIPTKLALEALNANPKTTIMIGDAPTDFISAKNAGIDKTILVATGQVSFEELSKTSPYVLKSLKDLKCLMI